MLDNSLAWPKTLMATHSGLRGRVGIDLSPAVIRRVVGSFVTLLAERGAASAVAVARDDQPGSKELAENVIDLIRETGFGVVDFGAVSTPTAKLAARLRGLGGCAIVTASHLGPGWNGLKFIASPLYFPTDIRELLSLDPAPPDLLGGVSSDGGAVQDHVDALLAGVDVESIRAASLRVTACGGVGSLPRDVLLRLGCRQPRDGIDLGLRLDPDGDRLQLVDERGAILDEEVVLPLVAIACEARRVVKGADSSRMLDAILRERGGFVEVVSPGELHLLERIVAIDADLAGEGNGGVVVPSVGLARDGLAAAVSIIDLLVRTQMAVSELVAGLPRYVRKRTNIPCGGPDRALDSLTRLALSLDAQPPSNPEDGLQVEAGDAWGLVRLSATEQVLRVTVEAADEGTADDLHRELLAVLQPQPIRE